MTKQEFSDKFFNAIKMDRKISLGEWSGGNDSGSYNSKLEYKNALLREFDPEKVEEIIDATEDAIDTILNYGSFAGNFYTQGYVEIEISTSLEESNVILEGEETDYDGVVRNEEVFVTPLTKNIQMLDSIVIEDNNVYCYLVDGQLLQTNTDFTDIIDNFIEEKDINVFYQEFDIDKSIVTIDGKPYLKLELYNIVNEEISIYHEVNLTDLIDKIWKTMQ